MLGVVLGVAVIDYLEPEVIHQVSVTRAPDRASAQAEQAQPAVMSRSRPVQLAIPAIDVTSRLIRLGLNADGSMQVPPKGFPAGWFTGAPAPGQRGPAVIVGHVDWAGRPGVFARLHTLVSGDLIMVRRADGTVARFRVSTVRSFDKDAFPTDLVYGNQARAVLRLITCGGSFDRQRHSYRKNVIVFAELLPASG